MEISWPLIVIGCISGIALIWFIRFVTTPKYPYVHRDILSIAELRFFTVLKTLIPDDLYLSVKPRLGDLIDVEQIIKDKDAGWIRNYGAATWSKHIDFVIFDVETAEVILCIELDDASHNRAENKARDIFKNKALKAAEIPLLRIKVAHRYAPQTLQKKIEAYF